LRRFRPGPDRRARSPRRAGGLDRRARAAAAEDERREQDARAPEHEDAEGDEDDVTAALEGYVADGYDVDFIRDNLERDRDNFLTHLDEGQKIYRAIGDCAPAFGMIGTLIGMVQMFANMTDPSKLGPFMAVALLATFYGAAVANLFCLPIADKLHGKLVDEEINRTLIIDGVLMIREAKSPSVVREMLLAYVPEKNREEMVEAAAA